MNYKIAFFGTKPYDRESFQSLNGKYGYEIKYFKGNLNADNVPLTKGMVMPCAYLSMIRRMKR